MTGHQSLTDNRQLVVTLDDSGRDMCAREVAAALATRFDLGVTELSVVPPGVSLAERWQRIGDVDRQAPRAAGIRLVRSGHVPNAIVGALRGRVAVMATNANPFNFDSFIGSVAEAVAAASPAPLVLVGPDVEPASAWDVDRVIAPVGSDLEALAALPAAAGWAQLFEIPLTALHVANEGITAGPTWWPEKLFGESTDVIEDASPAHGIAEVAGARSLVVMTTSGRQGLDRIVHGSVMSAVVREAPHPVVVLGPHCSRARDPFA